MSPDAFLAVAIGGAALTRAAVAIAAVIMCRSAQRQGREVRFEVRHLSHHLSLYCGPEAIDDTPASRGIGAAAKRQPAASDGVSCPRWPKAQA
jgi:hypothetical protein